MSSKKSLNPRPCVIWLTYLHCIASLFALPLSLFVLIIFCRDNPDFNLLLLIPSSIIGIKLLGVFPLLLEPTRFNLFKLFLKDFRESMVSLSAACLPAIVLGYLSPAVTSSLSLVGGCVLLVTSTVVLWFYFGILSGALELIVNEFKSESL